MEKVKEFNIVDIDGCEFISTKAVGRAMISFHYDEAGCETGDILVVYPDASWKVVDWQKAQKHIDSGDWTVYR
jgi:hypothetical protein